MKICIGDFSYPVIIANSIYLRFMGLMGRQNFSYGMFFPKCNAIHTFFMKEAIDVIGLDENHKVIFLEQHVKPNRILHIPYPEKKTSILELPTHTNLSVSLGDSLFFEGEDVI